MMHPKCAQRVPASRATILRRPKQGRRRRLSPARAMPTEEKEMLEQEFEKSIDAAGAGATWTSPGWLTQLNQLWGGKSDAPVADAQPDDIKDLLGGALFKALYKWMEESGPIYLLPTGPVSSFLVVSDPDAAKHILMKSDNPKDNIYGKGLVAEVSEFLFGIGFATSGGDDWRVRRRAVGPSMHRAYLEEMLDRVFAESALRLNSKLAVAATEGRAVDIEACFSQLTLDVIGKAVFNYDFDALNKESPIIQAVCKGEVGIQVYTALKETESRATDLLPLWKVPALSIFIPRQRRALAAVETIRATTEELIARCKEMVDEEERAAAAGDEEYLNQEDPSILRFLIASRDEASAQQLRDDLLGMLVAGHETTASVLTWTIYLLCGRPECLAKVQEEVDRVIGGADRPTLAQYRELKYTMRCVNESMRMYPHPPVLLRRALREDTLPSGLTVPKDQDVMISVYNIHRSPAVWDDPNDFRPERFPIDEPIPTELNTGFRFIPFSGGPRKCVGDQFALMEAIVALALLVKRYDVAMVPNQDPGMTTGATIHTVNGLYVTVSERSAVPAAA